MYVSVSLICKGVKTLYPAMPELITLSISICLDPFQTPLTMTLSHLEDSSEIDLGVFVILLLNCSIKFDFSWPLSTCHRPRRKKVVAKKIKKTVIFFPGLNFLKFIY
jgi:hypothetical protein